MNKADKQQVIDLARKMVKGEKYCFCKTSSSSWIKKFAGKRFDFVIDCSEIREDENPPSEKIIMEAKKIFIKEYYTLIQKYIDSLPEKSENKLKNKNSKK